MATNRDAIVLVLDNEGIEFRELDNDSGWMIEITTPVEGSEMERILRVIDVVANVQCIIIPNVGLSIQTSGFEEEEAFDLAEVTSETDEPIEEEATL